MPRLPRFCPAGLPSHLVQRGHNRQNCFATTRDFATYAHFLHDAAQRCLVQVHAWVFMTNHVHILATPQQADALSKMMQTLNRNYVCYFNAVYQRTGTLWEGRFKSCLIDSTQYLLQCYRYIELNPVRAGLVRDPVDYAWSSYRCNALGLQSALVTPHPEYLHLGKNLKTRLQAYRDLLQEQQDNQLLQDIRDSTSRNMALGSTRFKEEIETTLSRRVRPARRGRPRKEI